MKRSRKYALEESRNTPIEEAKAAGAMMLFGEKYGENVRMISFDKSIQWNLRWLSCGRHWANWLF